MPACWQPTLAFAFEVIPIQTVFQGYRSALADVFAGWPEDTTEENLQARVRGNLLMALSNKFGHLVLSTGNKSELAVGYCTLYGDMAGGPGGHLRRPKTADLSAGRATSTVRARSFPSAPSGGPRRPNFGPNQTDQDSLPEYEVFGRHSAPADRGPDEREGNRGPWLHGGVVREVVQMIHRSEYKRRQAAPGLKVTNRAFGTGRRIPIAMRLDLPTRVGDMPFADRTHCSPISTNSRWPRATLQEGKRNDTATFESISGTIPFRGGYAIVGRPGRRNSRRLSTRVFTPDDLQYLASLQCLRGICRSFRREFLDLPFQVPISADDPAPFRRDTVVFPNEPLPAGERQSDRVSAPRIILLCHINFQTLVATKAARMWEAVEPRRHRRVRAAPGPGPRRRAQRLPGRLHRRGRCHVERPGGRQYLWHPSPGHARPQLGAVFSIGVGGLSRLCPDLPGRLRPAGGHLRCPEERDPQRNPVGRELEARGHRLAGIRHRQRRSRLPEPAAREMFDQAGLALCGASCVSNELDEYHHRRNSGRGGQDRHLGRRDEAGDRLRAKVAAALGGVYKMVEHNGKPKIKLSGNPEKMTNPGSNGSCAFSTTTA